MEPRKQRGKLSGCEQRNGILWYLNVFSGNSNWVFTPFLLSRLGVLLVASLEYGTGASRQSNPWKGLKEQLIPQAVSDHIHATWKLPEQG